MVRPLAISAQGCSYDAADGVCSLQQYTCITPTPGALERCVNQGVFHLAYRSCRHPGVPVSNPVRWGLFDHCRSGSGHAGTEACAPASVAKSLARYGYCLRFQKMEFEIVSIKTPSFWPRQSLFWPCCTYAPGAGFRFSPGDGQSRDQTTVFLHLCAVQAPVVHDALRVVCSLGLLCL